MIFRELRVWETLTTELRKAETVHFLMKMQQKQICSQILTQQ